MEISGWEMRPAGWISLIVLAGVLAYFLNQWLQTRSRQNPEESN
jgi:hypothetical protein